MAEVTGLSSALIVPCYMCPAVSVAIRKNKPFMQFFRSVFKSPPFEAHLREMQSCLKARGVKTEIFRSLFYHQWFLCIWTAARRKKLQKKMKLYDAVIVLGCDSATETIRDLVESMDCKVIEGMKTAGITNAKPQFRLPCDVYFKDCKTIPLAT
ncbi:MAG: hypothetical protein JRE18_06065 [Deltaproteobacteria bacterium]|nr:hypothetical protein [Deltaproteobacteria bacterium]